MPGSDLRWHWSPHTAIRSLLATRVRPLLSPVGVLLLLVVRRSRHWYLDAIAVTYVVAVSWSRVYLRAHWLSDVVAGAAGGAAVAISVFLVVSIFRRHRARLAGDDPEPAS